MVIITPQKQIDAYFDSDDLGQSSLKKLLTGMDSFLANQENQEIIDDKPSIIIGSAVDTILTGEQGEFDNQYYLSQIEKKPSDTEIDIVKFVFDEVTNFYDESIWRKEDIRQYPGTIIKACNHFGWQPRWKDETKVKNISEKCTEYFEDLKNAYGLKILDTTIKTQIDEIVHSLRTNPRTSIYFDRPALQRAQDVDIYYQLPIYFEYRNVKCKALLDFVIVTKDSSNNILSVQGFDLKTMHGNTLQFMASVKTWRYDIQAAWYRMALYEKFKLHNEDILYKPFTFVVESSNKPGTPLLYEAGEGLLQSGQSGRPELTVVAGATQPQSSYPIKHKEIKGYKQLMDDYLYYQQNGWNEERIITEYDGVFKIDWNGIIQ